MIHEQVLGKVVTEALDLPIGIPIEGCLSRVTMICSEFTSRCPVTQQPDFGTVEISFIPSGQIIESKSLKLYLLKFRERGVFCEALSIEIAEDIFKVIDPKEVQVKVIQAPRGGIMIVAEAHLEQKGPIEYYSLNSIEAYQQTRE